MLRFIFAATIGLGLHLSAYAHEYKQGEIEIGHPWARPTAGASKNGAAYLTLKNDGKEGDKLLSIETPAAEKAQVHEHVQEGEVMKMRAVEGGVPVPPGETVTFKPAGYHIMLMGLKQPLEDGKSIPMKLTFAKAGAVDVEVKIEKNAPAQQAMDHMDNMDHDHMHMDMKMH